MTFSYYPGCTLKTRAKELDKYARLSAEKLGVELKEIDGWQCCGGCYPVCSDEIAQKLSSVRALAKAEKESGKLITVCSACHNVIKRVDFDAKNDENFRLKTANYMSDDEKYGGNTKVMHYIEMLRDEIGFDKIKEAVKNPLGEKIAAYYGCLLLRPGKIMAFDDPENPSIMEDLISALGGIPVKSALRNECCGGYITMEDKSIAENKSRLVLENAKKCGAAKIITACPLCLYNLRKANVEGIEVVYFTELLAKALGIEEE